MSVALAPPFFVLLAQQQAAGDLAGLGMMVIASGIAAARLAERFHVPSVLLTSDGRTARGSGRTAGEWDLLGLLRNAAGEYIR